MQSLLCIFYVQVYSFPLQSTFTDDANECLPKVLTDNHPLIVKVFESATDSSKLKFPHLVLF